MKKLNLLIVFLCLAVFMQAQLYVDIKASGMDDGSSWSDAYTDLEKAIDAADQGSSIWIAGGSYHPKATINLNERGIDLYGSFEGDESDPSQRTFQSRTIISGDVNKDDLPGDYSTNDSDNLLHVMFIIESLPMVIDGIIIEGGRADEVGPITTQSATGGGIYCNGEISFENCIVRNNRARYGGGIYLVHTLSVPGVYTFKSCTIEGNVGRSACGIYAGFGGTKVDFDNVDFINNDGVEGGAILIAGATAITKAKFTDCLFEGNDATYGGAVEVEGLGRPVFEDCQFLNNTSSSGGAVNMNDYSSADFIGCLWGDNEALESVADPGLGGAIYITEASTLNIVDGLFIGNYSEDAGGAIFSLSLNDKSNKINITNTDFVDSYCQYGNGGAIHNQGKADYSIKGTEFFVNEAIEGGAIFTNGSTNLDCDDCQFFENIANYGGAILVNEYNDDIKITESVFSGNYSFLDGGAFYNYRGAMVRIKKSVFESNESGGWGGAVYTLGQGSPEVSIYSACEFKSNSSAATAGAVYAGDMNLLIINSVFNTNEATGDGIGNSISTNQSQLSTVNKTVLVNNTFHENADGLSSIAQWSNGSATSVIEAGNNIFSGAGTLWALEDGLADFISLGGNLCTDESMNELLTEVTDLTNVDPKFINSSAGDFRIESSSPCVDGGISEGAPNTDITGLYRVGTPDIGAYEAEYDCDADGGRISLSAGGQKIELCQGQVKFSAKHDTDSELPYFYIVTDADDVILKAIPSNTRVIDLSDAPSGECHLWGFSYNRLVVPNVGAHIETLLDESCGDLSRDYIRVLRLSPEECNEPCHTPRNMRVSTSDNHSNVRWSRVPDAKYYLLKISYEDSREPLVFQVRRNHVKITSYQPYYSVSVSAVCGYGEESGYSDAIWIGEMPDQNVMTASTRSGDFRVEEINEELSFSAFPNPVGEVLHIEIEIETGSSEGAIEIYDMIGRLQIAKEADLQMGQLTLDVSTLRDGMYTLRVTDKLSGQTKNQMISKVGR